MHYSKNNFISISIQDGSEQSSDQPYSKVVGFASSSGNGSLSAVSAKKEAHEDTKLKIEDSLIVEELKEDDSPVYVRLKHEAKESEHTKIEDKVHGKKITQSKDEKTLHDIFENKTNQGTFGTFKKFFFTRKIT